MNRQTLLSIYERLEAVISKLPGPLQNAVMGELNPIKQAFLSQRLARIVLVGKPGADASALLSSLLGTLLQMIEAKQTGGWVTYELRGRGGFRILDARRLNETSLTWKALEGAISEESPDLFLFLVHGSQPLDLGLECEQTARLLEMAELRHRSKAGLIGVIDLPSATPRDVAEARRLELQAWLSGPGKLSAHFVKSVEVCSFVRFRVDGSIDPDRDERRNVDLLGEVLARELPGEAQVEMARLVGAKNVQLEVAHNLVRSLTTVCGAIGVQPIPFADFPILTAIQFAMVSGIMHVSGRELGLRSAAEFFGALGINIGAGMIFREGARAAAKLLPGWGNAISGGVAAGGTYAVGRSAIGYFIEGISIREARKLFHRQALPKTR
ncbi:MAG: DUF697 domain-containing protein [Verrucomicrobia bacterium]|nr:DUF697 domain-containing protein [Verrucomicrobiota bacterium]MBV9643811.1 DUF697 domain-containing protein [Verrucomicrobiota bacterium]